MVVLAAGAARAQPAPEPTPGPPLAVPRITSTITIDGQLNEPAWKEAAILDAFWETTPGDNVPPKVKTVAYLAYDERFLYIGVKCFDDGTKVRAPYVERDQVLGTDDNIAVFLDTRNDRRSAIEFRVNPRGIQGDAMCNDANQQRGLLARLLLRHRGARRPRTGGPRRYRDPVLVPALPEGGHAKLGNPDLAQLSARLPLRDLLEPAPARLELLDLPHRAS